MTQIELAMDERLMLVKYLTVLATDTGETLEDARAQAKQEIDRIVNKGDVLSLSRIKTEVVKKQKAEEEAATAKKLADLDAAAKKREAEDRKQKEDAAAKKKLAQQEAAALREQQAKDSVQAFHGFVLLCFCALFIFLALKPETIEKAKAPWW
jgi:hypothetical protein